MKNTILIIILSLSCIPFNFAQILIDFPCYSISAGNGAPNVLFEYNPSINEWLRIGITGGTSIEAIATDPISDIIYAVDGGIFGTINANTALFNVIGTVGMANGAYGEIALNDVDGLTYDPINQIMYATHRIEGIEPGTNDLLFQIDVSTGSFVPGAMTNAVTSEAVDYAVVPKVFDGDFGGYMYDLSDIAYSPFRGWLCALHKGGRKSTVTILNPKTGELSAVIYDLPDDDVEGIGFSYLGDLYGTTGNDGGFPPDSNTFIFIDLDAGSTQILSFIDPTGVAEDFESFDCLMAFNDLALDMVASHPIPSFPGNHLTFSITIFNQGDFDNIDIRLTDYIPTGLILNDAAWTDLGNGTATITIPGPLVPGASLSVPITFKVDPSYVSDGDFTTEDVLTNAAEITKSINPDITDIFGNPLGMPDIDSKADNQNDEINIVDNAIDEGGPFANEDEDDHDIETLYNIQYKENPIKFRITNAIQEGEVSVEDGKTIIPIKFDLSIDSLGVDLSADELCFSLYLPDSFKELSIETIYEPLIADELSISKTACEVNICINRLNNGDTNYPLIASDSPSLRFKVKIVAEDLGGEGFVIEPIHISGYTKVTSYEVISFKSATLPIGFDYDGAYIANPQNRLEISLQLHHKNCRTLGALEIEVLNNSLSGIPTYTYTLKDITGALQNHIKVSNSAIHQFDNLEEGEYVLEVKDSNGKITSKKISIDFVAGQLGSLCCAEHLIIPPGLVSGQFDADNIISFSEGTLITNGTFEICE